MPKAFENLSRSAQWRIRRNLRPRNREGLVLGGAADLNDNVQRAENEGNGRDEDGVLPNHNRDAENFQVNHGDQDLLHDEADDEDGMSGSSSDSSGEEDELSDNDGAGRLDDDPQNGDVGEEEAREDESDDENEGDDLDFFELGDAADRPLYLGAPLNVMESMCLIMTLVLKHNISGTCLADILTVINMHCIQQNLRKWSLYKYQKFFSVAQNLSKKHYYCSRCCKPLQTANDQCPCAMGASYFLQYPLVPQLKQLFGRDNFMDLLQHRFTRDIINPESVEDIYDGSLYKELVADGFLANPNNLSLLWNADGAPVFKSKNYSIWPFYLVINELPYKLRFLRKNVLLAGLWFGPKKPRVNLFVKSFKSDLQKLYQGQNFNFQGQPNPVTVKAVLIAGTCDLPAKCTFLNMSQYNAVSGCPCCEAEGTQVILRRNDRNTPLRVYSYERNYVMRTKERCRRLAEQAFETGEIQKGVKGPTALDHIMPDFIAGMGIYSMHNVSGVVKKLLKLWFDSKFSAMPFSMRRIMPVIDQILLRLKPPKFIHRMPRTVEDLCHWKASELLIWLHYYAPVILENTMRPNIFQHFMKLVAGLSLLNCLSVSNNMINTANHLLQEFVQEYEALYGLRHCSMNVHLLLHLANQVRTLGPLWTCSCFHFENLNGLLLSGLHGNTNIDSQLTRQHWQTLSSARFLDRLPDGPVRDFSLWQRRKFKVLSRVAESCYSVGFYADLAHHRELILRALEISNIIFTNVMKYARLFKKNMMYVSSSYNRDLKTVSSCCLYSAENVKQVGSILCFVKVCRQCAPNMICECQGDHFAILKKITVGERFRVGFANNREPCILEYIFNCQPTDNIIAVRIASLLTVCFYMQVREKLFIALPDHIRDLL